MSEFHTLRPMATVTPSDTKIELVVTEVQYKSQSSTFLKLVVYNSLSQLRKG